MVHSSINLPTSSAVPRRGSIMGTRRSGSRPTSNTSESQLAATISSGHLARQRPRKYARVDGGRLLSTAVSASASVDEAGEVEPVGRGAWPGACRGTAGPWRAGGRRPMRARGVRRTPRAGAAWPPSRRGGPPSPGSRSSPVRTSSHMRSTSAPTSSPTHARPRSRSYLRARSTSCPLDVDGPQATPVLQADGALHGRVVAHVTDGGDRVGQHQVGAEHVVLDHGQHDGGGAHLQERGRLGHVGVADDDVEAAVLGGVAVRLVTRVDDGPLQRRLEADLLLEEVGPLADLVTARRCVPSPGSSTPTLPAPQMIWRVTKWGVIWLTMRPNGVSRAMR